MRYCLFFFLLTYSLFASERPHLAFVPFDSEHYSEIKSEKEIDMGRYRTQDSIGNCYAMTLAKTLEYFCKNQKNCDLQEDEISPLYLEHVRRGGIFIDSNGGDGITTLKNLYHDENKDLYLVRESCAPFDQTLHETVINTNSGSKSSTTHKNGLDYLEKIYQKVKSGDCEDCSSSQLAQQVKSNLPNFDRNIHEVETILNRAKGSTLETFLAELLIPFGCRGQTKKLIKIPPFKYHISSSIDLPTPQNVIAKIVELLDQNIPPELNICDGKKNKKGKRVCGTHSIIVNGYRYRCKSGSCSYEFKVHNSWGKSWQDNNNDGWVDALTLTKFALEEPTSETQTKSRGDFLNLLTWITSNAPATEVKKEVPPTPVKMQKKEKKIPAKSTNFWICRKSGANPTLIHNHKEMSELTKQGFQCK